MNTIPKRVLIASLTTAVLATTALAHAQTARPLFGSPFSRVPLTTGHAIQSIRPFSNPTTRTTFVSGGATLPALAYEGSSALTLNPSTPVSGSIFAYFAALTGVTTRYCQTGSGFGKRVFDGDTAKPTGGVNGACAAIGVSPAATNGFGAPSSLGLTDPDITGSDSPLTQAEYANFATNKGALRGESVEVPSIVGSVALLYNNPDLKTTKLNLTDSQICSIVEGKITNWSQLGKPARALLFAYRADGSGTTFSFSNHLVAVCGSGSKLSTSQQFAPGTGTTPPYVIPGAAPANFGGFSGNQGVVTGIKANVGAIGYVEAANAKAAVGGSVQFATVNSKDPVKDLPQTAAALVYSGATIALDSAVVTAGGAATTAPLTGVKKAGCVQLVKPSAYAKITQGYPIVAVTYFLFSSNGNGATNAGHLQALVNEVNTPANFGSHITSVNKATTTSGTGTTGFAALGTSFNAALESAAKSCIGA